MICSQRRIGIWIIIIALQFRIFHNFHLLTTMNIICRKLNSVHQNYTVMIIFYSKGVTFIVSLIRISPIAECIKSAWISSSAGQICFFFLHRCTLTQCKSGVTSKNITYLYTMKEWNYTFLLFAIIDLGHVNTWSLGD